MSIFVNRICSIVLLKPAMPLAVLCTAAAIATPAWSTPLNLDLPLIPFDSTTTNRLNITVSSSGSEDSTRTRLTGNVLSVVDYDIVNSLPRINTIQFTGGTTNILGETTNNVELRLSSFIGAVDITGIGVEGRLATPQPPSVVASNGNFATEDHSVQLFEGTLEVVGSGLFSSINETVDLAGNPIELTQTGTGSIAVQQISTNGLNRTFEATITLPVDAEDTVQVSGDTTATVSAVGNVVASTNFTITFPFEGDYNGNGVVDAADYTVWRDMQGRTGAGLAADGNFDLAVDAADYNLWQSNFGNTAPGLGGGALVPEPTSLALASGIFALCVFGMGRGRLVVCHSRLFG